MGRLLFVAALPLCVGIGIGCLLEMRTYGTDWAGPGPTAAAVPGAAPQLREVIAPVLAAAARDRAPIVARGAAPFAAGVRTGEFAPFSPLVIHEEEALPEAAFAEVAAAARELAGKAERQGDGRRNLMIPKGHRLAALVAKHLAPVCERAIFDETALRAKYVKEFPVELRVYDKGVGMQWHRDYLLYAERQFEMVFTVSNDGAGVTEYIGRDRERVEVATAANSVLLIRAEGVRHRVRDVPGERIILKAVFSRTLDKAPGLKAYEDSPDFQAWAEAPPKKRAEP